MNAPSPWPAHLAAYFADDGVPLRPRTADAEAAAAAEGGVQALLTFFVGAELHALDIQRISEVLKFRAVTRVPMLQAGVLGIISVRGNLVPVVDLAHFFATSAPAEAAAGDSRRPTTLSHVVVLGDEQAPLGIAVGAMVGVHRLPLTAFHPRRATAVPAVEDEQSCVAGFATTPQNEALVVLDGPALALRFAEL